MRNSRTLAAFLALLFFANLSWAQGIISHVDVPAPGSNSGEIKVNGKIVVDNESWEYVTDCKVRVWEDGTIVSEISLTVQPDCTDKTLFTWMSTIDGFGSSVKYNITVEVTVSNGCDTAVIRTALATVTAK